MINGLIRHSPRNASNFCFRIGCNLVTPPYARRFRSDLHTPLASEESKVVFSGIQPTGIPHLGNYLGALQQWQKLQTELPASTKFFYSIVDLHAITLQQNAQDLRKWKRETLASLLALDLDPKRCTIFYQSAVQEHTELMWILSCTASVGRLSRMTQWKSKLSQADTISGVEGGETPLKLALLSYPVLQAADILLYSTTHVPVGEDQVQHLEFTRDVGDAFNAAHGQVFIKPHTLLSPTKRVMSLKEPHLKMSKSHLDPRSRIHINDSQEDIACKIRQALTDSIHNITYDPANRPGISNMLDLVSCFHEEGKAAPQIAEECHDMRMREFKDYVTRSLDRGLAPIRERYFALISDKNDEYLDDVVESGAITAQLRARQMMERVRAVVGLV